jgi:hypothetical protein
MAEERKYSRKKRKRQKNTNVAEKKENATGRKYGRKMRT